MSHIFVSYAHEDCDFAELLMSKLEASNLSSWRDSESLRVGDDWKQKIDDAITRSFALILIVTSHSNKSVYVMYEWVSALSRGVPIIPVLRESVQLHPRLNDHHYLDFTSRQNRPWSNLMEQLAEKKTNQLESVDELLTIIAQASRAITSIKLTDRKEAIETLEQIRHPKAMEELFKATKSHIKGARYMAAVSFAKITNFSDIRAAPIFIEMLNDKEEISELDKDTAKKSLEQMKNSIKLTLLILNLKKDDPIMADAAVELLGRRKDDLAIEAICDILTNDSNTLAKYNAAKVLGRCKSPNSIPPLKNALLDTTYDNRTYGRVCDMAARALISIGTLESISIAENWLINTINNQILEFEIRYLAANTLEQIGSVKSLQALKSWKIGLAESQSKLNDGNYSFDDAYDSLS